jgi:hypothetical protein
MYIDSIKKRIFYIYSVCVKYDDYERPILTVHMIRNLLKLNIDFQTIRNYTQFFY